ncbi:MULTISPECIES: hypothetical protein [Ferroplasma]|jgi:hypothetical protein|uniref:Uncharacterized protein n=2 Tax=Ferroplasma TaxID=74968 RepID=S0AMV0_FERAC|nr:MULTISPECIES: hypothetical protein [Ferroplasma]MCL4349688.1 hypothetical protein [Candidatus Thermoplasmatota archaeon]AGO60608.1 hypothetical protein FACI_IFERC00001G0628 [Ferroplasma acidarmanus Fer1]ARD85370.1 hypothetical protein FAD_1518 [Ferroplasma acidiphilum]NOL61047.1 hypothetical protein [Ferroplasma acidiphilum]WMT52478.1 MAG: hypothetical protein RE473_05555 [Ferroplasma acidiphilum]
MDDNNNAVMGFKLDEEPKWIRVTLEDGTVLEIKTEIMSIMKVGNDPNTGLPQYSINAAPMIRMMRVPKESVAKKADTDKGLYR